MDDYEWPSGEVRDVWLRGLPSRVIAADPEFRMRSIGYAEKDVLGPSVIETDRVENPVSAVAFRKTGENALDPDSLTDIPAAISDGRVRWNVPAGDWKIIVFYLHTSQGRDGGLWAFGD